MYSLQVLYCGSITADESFHFYGHPIGNLIDSPSYYYLLSDGADKILVDSGFDDPETVLKHIGMKCTAPMTARQVLASAGTCPEDIKAVIYTHLHWDHVSNITAYPNAEFYCQAEELEWVLDPPAWAAGYNRYLAGRIASIKDRFHALSGACELFPGIRILKTGGHSYGSQAVIVDTPEGRVALTGDNIARYRNYEEDIPAGLIVDLKSAYSSIADIKACSDIILPSHDWLVMERYPHIANAPQR